MKAIDYIHLFGWTMLPLVFCPLGGQAQGVHLTPGIYWVAQGSPSMVLNNASLINNGNFIPDSGTVIFTSDMATTGAFIGGANPVSFYNLTIGKSAKHLQLNNNAFVTGRITLDSGNLQLNDYTLDLGTTGSIQGESNYSRITGTAGGVVKTSALLNAPHLANPGNIGVAISSEANLGWTTITRGHIQQAVGASSGIQRYFDIDPENNSGQPGSLRLYYLDGELDGRNGHQLSVFSRERDGLGWTSHGKDQSDPIAGWVTKENVGLLQRFTLAIPGGQGKGSDHFLETLSVRVSPNPSAGTFRMALVSDREMDRVIGLYDLSGHLLERKIMHCIQGMNVLEWNATRLAQGTYQLATDGLAPVKLAIIK
jgi:hypothetical protein